MTDTSCSGTAYGQSPADTSRPEDSADIHLRTAFSPGTASTAPQAEPAPPHSHHAGPYTLVMASLFLLITTFSRVSKCPEKNARTQTAREWSLRSSQKPIRNEFPCRPDVCRARGDGTGRYGRLQSPLDTAGAALGSGERQRSRTGHCCRGPSPSRTAVRLRCGEGDRGVGEGTLEVQRSPVKGRRQSREGRSPTGQEVGSWGDVAKRSAPSSESARGGS